MTKSIFLMKQFYAILLFSFVFPGMQAQAGSSSLQKSPVPVVDPSEAAATGADMPADGAGEPAKMAQGPMVKSEMPAWQEKASTVSITSITMPDELNIAHFGNYQVEVDLDVDNGITVHTVTLSTTPVSYTVKNEEEIFEQEYDWNYYTHDTDGSTASNDPVVKVKTGGEFFNDSQFRGIRPDDIYPEIHFASSDITHYNEPKDIIINRDNIQLMKFNNPFNMVANTSFFIEFYAEPADQRPPRAMGLDVYLVGNDKDKDFFADDNWMNDDDVSLVATINHDDDFNHLHSEHSKHHVVYLSADENGEVQGIDVDGNFWVVLTSNTSLERRSWNLKYHKKDGEGEDCDNQDTWFTKNNTGVVSQTGCPDAHVHIARNAEDEQVDGVEHDVTVKYSADDNGDIQTVSTDKYFYFGDIPDLAPNPSSFIGPAAGVYSGKVTLEWYPATDPNNNEVKYDIFLYDVGTQTDVYTITENHSGKSFEFDTQDASDPENDSPADGVYNIRMVARDAVETGDDGEALYSSSWFLYDIYEVGEEFVIAKNPFKWTGDAEDNFWKTPENWENDEVPGPDNLAFIKKLDEIKRQGQPEIIIDDETEAEAKRLQISAGKVIIESGGSLTIGQSLVNEAGIQGLVVKDGGSLIQNTPWPSKGIEATLDRQIVGGGDWTKNQDDAWHFLSSPVGTQTITTFTEDLENNSDYDFYGWSEEDDLWINQKGSGNDGPEFSDWNDGDNFVVGRGYLVAYETTQDFQFTGELNIQDVVKQQLTKTKEDEEPPYESGWHLLGNPFASRLIWGDWSMTNVAETAKIWSEGGYKDVQQHLNPKIPAHQGFFIQVEDEGDNNTGTVSGTITIPAKARTHGGTLLKQQQVPHIVLTASATESGLRQRNVVREAPECGGNFNAVFLAGHAPQFYAIPDEVPLSTTALEEITDETVIPYAFIKNHEGSEFRIALEKTMEDKDLYLVDLVADVEHHLKVDDPYVFTSSADDPAERFELRFAPSDEPTSVDPPDEKDDHTKIYLAESVLYLEFSKPVTNARLEVVDAAGRIAVSDNLGNGSAFSMPLSLNTGIYVVRVISDDHIATRKIVFP